MAAVGVWSSRDLDIVIYVFVFECSRCLGEDQRDEHKERTNTQYDVWGRAAWNVFWGGGGSLSKIGFALLCRSNDLELAIIFPSSFPNQLSTN